MKLLKSLLPVLVLVCTQACAQFKLDKNAVSKAKESAKKIVTKDKPLSNDEVINGLKEALNVGSNNASGSASKLDGFYKNPAIKIPFPPEAQTIKSTVTNLGMGSQVEKFEESINRAAEEAAKEAAPVFLNAITSMSIGDGFAILKGADNAATQYLSDKTTPQLREKFTPIIKNAIEKVGVTRYWEPLITKYNSIPFIDKQNPNLTDYVLTKALSGLFTLLADEELKIRKDPKARINDLLQRVFGSLGTTPKGN